ncbi:MAG: exo-alpha-sialidase [Candidatus Marinimicrobia bacterium]|jgi:predicted neuraminidase|nr:exo-alpha-sialidase [Candidatus Neomarinimicrobiota bacterium]MBT3500749.1 exo-alpha-sialidase [Candidatus Neomarinimicrobiota bacterium]MBT3838696.1 exo-alpha-sialidase [Candidatus Neomarinimicrobiota bacterium]MBT3998382.1 exo-alpha-sialidase [Candidatus Neomarinimicrobiota bacterium]MBT4283622.1 exo-alpha-sialidase [Candidatus Neomarinimicrobiota bacterium]
MVLFKNKNIFIIGLFIVGQIFGKGISKTSIFPAQGKHVHGSSIIEAPNGDLLACWFYGSGERTANDVVIQGSRLKKGSSEWGSIFVMADTPDLPDCNPVLFINENDELMLFWIAVRANGWENSVLRYKISSDYLKPGAPNWDWQDIIILKPGEEFYNTIKKEFEANYTDPAWSEYALPYEKLIAEAALDMEKRQKGWMTRIHPITLSTGRILLPLYSDGYNISLIGISDDNGKTWTSSKPIVGFGPVQPALIEKNDGSIIAYMRDNGGSPYRILVSESQDQGMSWTFATDSKILNPGSSIDAIELKNGHWVMIYNDTEDSRSSWAVSLSKDEGKTWKWTRHIGVSHDKSESYSYPSMIQTKDGKIHISYSYRNQEGKTILHASFNENWIKKGD